MDKDFHIISRLEEEEITSINAGYRSYKLIIKKAIIEEGSKCWGLTDFHIGEIALVKAQPHETARETLLHELTHLALEITGLGADDNDAVKVHTNEELTTQLSRGLLLLMNLNPKLFSIINERPEDHEE